MANVETLPGIQRLDTVVAQVRKGEFQSSAVFPQPSLLEPQRHLREKITITAARAVIALAAAELKEAGREVVVVESHIVDGRKKATQFDVVERVRGATSDRTRDTRYAGVVFSPDGSMHPFFSWEFGFSTGSLDKIVPGYKTLPLREQLTGLLDHAVPHKNIYEGNQGQYEKDGRKVTWQQIF